MDDVDRVAADPWVRGWLLVGGVMAAVAVIASLPWPLWIGWGYLGVLCLVDARRGARGEVAHTAEEPGVWQTRPDE
ncbi:hypothetical protein [Nocardioides sp. 1609]|uniref:hypothetical protein n=1 Tax=Nocardioides sp. 1609 TaxID=2508327 RepID=UPI00106FB6A4|nr:hypothetical protein [Nocardioides sp. 1609]